jgi:hypothetical protein
MRAARCTLASAKRFHGKSAGLRGFFRSVCVRCGVEIISLAVGGVFGVRLVNFFWRYRFFCLPRKGPTAMVVNLEGANEYCYFQVIEPLNTVFVCVVLGGHKVSRQSPATAREIPMEFPRGEKFVSGVRMRAADG